MPREKLYKKIVKFIEDNISEGIYVPGYVIPGEMELASMFNVSRMTARQATTELVNRGVLFRINGRGTMVSNNKIKRNAYFRGFTGSEDARAQGITAKVLSIDIIKADEELAKHLNLFVGEDVYSIKRIRYKNEIPFIYEIINISKRRFPNFDQHDIANDSFYKTLYSQYNVKFQYSDMELSASYMSNNEICTSLFDRKKEGVVVTILESTYDNKDQPIEYSISYYNANYFVTKYRLSNDNGYIDIQSP